MKITVNGVEKNLPPNASINELFSLTQIDGEQVVVEQNGTVVSPENYNNTALCDGDKIELIQFVGGG